MRKPIEAPSPTVLPDPDANLRLQIEFVAGRDLVDLIPSTLRTVSREDNRITQVVGRTCPVTALIRTSRNFVNFHGCKVWRDSVKRDNLVFDEKTQVFGFSAL